jgi:hypothetical protein
MFNWLIHKIIENKVNSAQIPVATRTKKEFLEWDNVNSVCLLATKDEFYKANSINEWIKNSGKKIDTVLYVPSAEIVSDNNIVSFNKKQTGFIGLPKPEAITKIKNKPYDILIDCNFKEYHSMKWLAGSMNAKFKVGFGGLLYHNYFDICIDLKEKPEMDNYLKQVINYLKMIRTKN